MDRSDRIARHSFTVFVFMFLIGFMRYFYKISMARMLEVRGYGLISSVEPIIILTASLFLTGFASALSKYMSGEIAKNNKKMAEDYLTTTFYYIFPMSLAASAIVFFSAGVIADSIFNEPDLEILIKILVLVMPLEALWLILDGIFLGYQESPYFTYSLFVNQLGILLMAILLVKMGLGTEGALIAVFIGDAMGLLCAYIIYLKKFKHEITLLAGRRSFALLRNLVSFAIPKTITTVSVMILMSFDIFCITYFLGVTYSGLYNAAVPIARMMLSFSTSLRIPLLPAISEDTAKERGHVRKYLADALLYVSAATIPLAVLMSVYSKELILLFFGPLYEGSSTALVILAFAMLFMAYSAVFSVIFQGMGNPEVPMKIAVFAVLFNIGLNIYLIPLIGIEGAAFSTLASMLMTLIYLSYKIRGFIDIDRAKSDIAKVGGLSLGLLMIVLIFKNQFFVGCTLGLAFYGLALVKFKVIDVRKFLVAVKD